MVQTRERAITHLREAWDGSGEFGHGRKLASAERQLHGLLQSTEAIQQFAVVLSILRDGLLDEDEHLVAWPGALQLRSGEECAWKRETTHILQLARSGGRQRPTFRLSSRIHWEVRVVVLEAHIVDVAAASSGGRDLLLNGRSGRDKVDHSARGEMVE